MDWSAVAAAAATTAGNMASGLFGLRKGAQLQRENIRYGLAEQRKHMSLLAQSMPSYELKGLQNAGINPMLDNGMQEPSSGSLASSPVPADIGHLGSDAVQAYQSFRLNESTIGLQRSNEERNYVESEVGRATITNIEAQTECTRQQATNLALDWYKIESQIGYYYSLQDKLYSEAVLNGANTDLAKAQTELAQSNKKSIDKYVDVTLPLQWKQMEQHIDVEKTQADLNKINFADISQRMTQREMDIMQASEALADNIKAAGVEAQVRLGMASLGLKDVEVLRQIKENPSYFNLRVASALLGQMSTDTKSDILGNLTQFMTGAVRAGGTVAGAMIGK